MNSIRDIFILVIIVAIFSGCRAGDISELLPFPTVAPEIVISEITQFSGLKEQTIGAKHVIAADTEGLLFQDGEVVIGVDDIEINRTMFINCQVFIKGRSNVEFHECIFTDLYQYEKAALNVSESANISVMRCGFSNNYIGMGIHNGQAEVRECRFENNNGHNALVIGEGSVAVVEGNYFYGNFPHAILVMNREESPQAKIDILGNIIEQTGEDAIDFEDYRHAAESLVAGNIIRNSGWSAVIVEYNSWDSTITISGNWIEGTGITWELPVHPLQPDEFQPGWGHGILVEDSGGVTIENNRILAAGGNGIEISNGRDVLVKGNGINCGLAGIGAYGYNTMSLRREFSPLLSENAGGTRATATGNIIYEAETEYEIDERSELSLD